LITVGYFLAPYTLITEELGVSLILAERVGARRRPKDRLASRRVLECRADIEVVSCVDIHRAGLTELCPRGHERVVLVEHLDAIVQTIGDVHITLGPADVDVVGLPEVAWFRPHVPPRLHERAVRRVLDDATTGILELRRLISLILNGLDDVVAY
jgi:hypothetical protein